MKREKRSKELYTFNLLNNKKGLSAIVATLMIILLAIVAFAIISVVIRNTISKGAQSIDLSGDCLEVEIRVTKVIALNNNTYNVTLSRTAGGNFPVDGVQLVFENEAATQNEIEEIKQEISALEKRTVTTSALTEVPTPAKVKVVPFFITESGDIYYCKDAFVFNIPNPIPTS